MPFFMTSFRCRASPEKALATNVAPAASAKVSGFTGFSTLPSGVDFVTMPICDVGDAWPVVRPNIWLSDTMYVMSTFLFAVW